ncbi:efflux RND transporter permease subunit, partial [Dryocola clanedunensis]
SLPALIGLLMLIGIATKNSILLVDYAVMAEDEHGMSQHDALIDACRKRAQPIIMTTLAMGAGMMPIALGFAGDSSFRAPMAIAVIGGLITSTLLSLIDPAIDSIGFGRSLLHPEHSDSASAAVFRDNGKDYPRYLAFSRSLWLGDKTRQLRIDDDNQVVIGLQHVQPPVLLEYDKHWDLKS